MNADQLRSLKNILNDNYGEEVIFCILENLGAFENGLNRSSSSKEDYLILGKREKGYWLLDCVYKADKQKYMDILKRAKEK